MGVRITHQPMIFWQIFPTNFDVKINETWLNYSTQKNPGFMSYACPLYRSVCTPTTVSVLFFIWNFWSLWDVFEKPKGYFELTIIKGPNHG